MASRYPLVTLAAALGLGLAVLPATLHAQRGNAPDAGSWAMEGGIGGANTASLLKFTTSSSAWLFTVDGQFATNKQDGSQTTGTDRTYTYAASGRLGLRSYHDHEGNVRPFTTFGFLAGAGKSTGGSNFESSFWNAGGFVELGAVYMFTPHLSLGGVGELNAFYNRQSVTNSSAIGDFETHNNSVIVNVGRFRVLAAVYF